MSDLFSLSHRFSQRPLYYITSDSVCQGLFPKFFELFFMLDSLVSVVVAVACQRPLYYITFSSLCQEVSWTFLSFFFLFFRSPSAMPSRRQLCYYTISLSPCQVLSSSFTLFSLCHKKQRITPIFVHRFVWPHLKTAQQWQSFFQIHSFFNSLCHSQFYFT